MALPYRTTVRDSVTGEVLSVTEHFQSPEPPPEGEARELLAILAEECAEVIQRATKSLRFGVTEVQPGQPLGNHHRLGQEAGEVLAVLDLAMTAGLVDRDAVTAARIAKAAKLAEFARLADPARVAAMRAIKAALDPAGIMNPGKLVP